jgi:hypothetical protein
VSVDRHGHDVDARAKLGSGYVRLEVFVTDAEFEAVRLEDAGRAAPVRHQDSLPPLQRPAARPGSGPDAMAVLTRVAGLMLVRRRELGGCC